MTMLWAGLLGMVRDVGCCVFFAPVPRRDAFLYPFKIPPIFSAPAVSPMALLPKAFVPAVGDYRAKRYARGGHSKNW